MRYPVSEIFDSLQGEGHWTGTPMTFVRLQGCDVGCDFCDTRYAWGTTGGTELSAEEIARVCRRPRICLTGGEPCLFDLEPLAAALMGVRGGGGGGRRIHLETSGRHPLRDGGRIGWVTVSPKPPGFEVEPGVLCRASELKYVVSHGFDPDVILRPAGVPVFLQPCHGDGYQESLRRTLRLTAERGLRLSLQTHKILGIR